jgi:hypothetical protein
VGPSCWSQNAFELIEKSRSSDIPNLPAAAPPSAPSPRANLADFGVTNREVMAAQSVKTTALAAPTYTNVSQAVGKPIVFREAAAGP